MSRELLKQFSRTRSICSSCKYRLGPFRQFSNSFKHASSENNGNGNGNSNGNTNTNTNTNINRDSPSTSSPATAQRDPRSHVLKELNDFMRDIQVQPRRRGGGPGSLGNSNSSSSSSSSNNMLPSMFPRGQSGGLLTGSSWSSPSAYYDTDYDDDDRFADEPFHLHCFSTKHNTHLTLTRPNRDAMISLSTGNIGFRKGQRGSWDAGFQLSAYVLRLIQEKGFLLESGAGGNDVNRKDRITGLEIVLRGYGQGRNAFLKAIMGVEGKLLRPKIVKLSDSTRLKYGGTRSPKPRRLG